MIFLKDLPKVFQSPMEKKIDNNKELFYSRLKEMKQDKNIPRKIDTIFHDRSFVYKKEVEITVNNQTEVKTIVGKSGNYLLTLDGDKIKISDIKDIKII